MKVCVYRDGTRKLRVEAHPQHFVIARVIVVREVDVVFPKQVVGDLGLREVHQRRGVFECEWLIRRSEQDGRKAADQLALARGRFARRH